MNVRAGTWCTVMRPAGERYEAMLQRYDGPESCIAVLYAEPGQDVPPDARYQHSVYVADPGNGAAVATLSYSPEQLDRVREDAQRFLDASS